MENSGMNEEERLTVTVPEAGRILGISRGQAYEMARTGGIPVIRLGKRLVVPRKKLMAMLEPSAHDSEDDVDGSAL
jgi:excisionase family DNA binding protein